MNRFRMLLVLGALLLGAAEARAQSYRIGQKVDASLVNGGVTFYPAVVVAVGQGDHAGEYLVRFEDGREDWRKPAGIQGAAAAGAPASPRAESPARSTPSAPQARRAMPASLPTGEYQCFYADADAFDSDIPGSYAASYMGSFRVLNANTYRYTTGTKLTGRYRYAPATGRIAWLSGSLDGSLFQGQFRPARGNDRASIRLRYRDAQGRTAVQHCRKIS